MDIIIALVGSRKRDARIIADVTAYIETLDRETIIVTGCASGTDAHVRNECERLGFRYVECHVRKIAGDWAEGAGPERNALIARLAQRVVAWPLHDRGHPHSTGTWNCVSQFEKRGKRVLVKDVAYMSPPPHRGDLDAERLT